MIKRLECYYPGYVINGERLFTGYTQFGKTWTHRRFETQVAQKASSWGPVFIELEVHVQTTKGENQLWSYIDMLPINHSSFWHINTNKGSTVVLTFSINQQPSNLNQITGGKSCLKLQIFEIAALRRELTTATFPNKHNS